MDNNVMTTIKDVVTKLMWVGVVSGVGLQFYLLYKLISRQADEFTEARRELEHAHWREKWGIDAPGVPLPKRERSNQKERG